MKLNPKDIESGKILIIGPSYNHSTILHQLAAMDIDPLGVILLEPHDAQAQELIKKHSLDTSKLDVKIQITPVHKLEYDKVKPHPVRDVIPNKYKPKHRFKR